MFFIWINQFEHDGASSLFVNYSEGGKIQFSGLPALPWTPLKIIDRFDENRKIVILEILGKPTANFFVLLILELTDGIG